MPTATDIRKTILKVLADFEDSRGNPLQASIGDAGRLTNAIYVALAEKDYLVPTVDE